MSAWDIDGDNVYDQFEVYGCDNPLAYNYVNESTENDVELGDFDLDDDGVIDNLDAFPGRCCRMGRFRWRWIW